MNIGFLKELRKASARQAWIYTTPILMALFYRMDPKGRDPRSAAGRRAADRQIHQLVARGDLVHICRGLFVDPLSRNIPTSVLEALIDFLRPWNFNYLSFESALHEHQMLSQVPHMLTVMTTGREGTFETPYGMIQFTHTDLVGSALEAGVFYDSTRRINIASKDRAQTDLIRSRRNVNLISDLNV